MSGPNSGQIWINGKVYDFLDVLQNDQMFPPSVSPTGSARVYFDQTQQKLMLSENGGAYAPIGGGGGGSQTPWASDINGGGYSLTNANNLTTVLSLGSELAPALTGATGVNWTFGSDWTSPLAGTAIHSSNGSTDLTSKNPLSIVAGKQYRMTILLSSFSAGSIGFTCNAGSIQQNQPQSGTYTQDFIADGSSNSFRVNHGSNMRCVIASISVKQILDNAGVITAGNGFVTTHPSSFGSVTTGKTILNYGSSGKDITIGYNSFGFSLSNLAETFGIMSDGSALFSGGNINLNLDGSIDAYQTSNLSEVHLNTGTYALTAAGGSYFLSTIGYSTTGAIEASSDSANSYYAQLGYDDGSGSQHYAGNFTDAYGNSVTLADGTYALNASGDSIINGNLWIGNGGYLNLGYIEAYSIGSIYSYSDIEGNGNDLTGWGNGYFFSLYSVYNLFSPYVYGSTNYGTLGLWSSAATGAAQLNLSDSGTIDVVGIITTSNGMPTLDPRNGTGTLWYDTVTNLVYRGT